MSYQEVRMRADPAPWGLHWFRRDLRVIGNPSLETLRHRLGGRVVGLFCFDREFLGRGDFSPDRFGFFLKTLAELKHALEAAGGDLLVIDQPPMRAMTWLIETLRSENLPLPQAVAWNRDYEPFARARDARMQEALKSHGIVVHTEADHLIVEPDEIAPPANGPRRYYSVYTPFFKRWMEALGTPKVRDRIDRQVALLIKAEPVTFSLRWANVLPASKLPTDQLSPMQDDNSRLVRVPLPPAGHSAARQALAVFGAKIAGYGVDRDFPDRRGTSRLSIYLKNGSLSSAQILALLKITLSAAKDKADGATIFLKEIAWREFYYHILWHRPDVENQAFLAQYRDLKWENRSDLFDRWKEGQTGYPIVDAGMRELATTGWMHNRVRMIVASFLTKDLLIDWRWGERYFMTRLLDGDLAANNGGWQWAASTGCDPQPYFRIFNPALQSQKFDPEGSYIARYVPELAPLSGTAAIHAPAEAWAAAHYMRPVVNHGERRMAAMALFKRT